MINLKFCHTFQYPDKIIEAIHSVASIIVDELNPTSIILFGSTSRNEASYVIYNEEIEILSDIEMIVITETKKDAPLSMNSRISAIENSLNIKNHLFHIEYGLTTLTQFKKSPKTIRTFDVKADGKTIYGENYLYLLPDVKPDNINKSRTNELILVRLLNQLVYTPKSIVKGKPSDYEKMIFNYITGRNMLDIPTILLATNGVLFSNYVDRVNYFNTTNLNIGFPFEPFRDKLNKSLKIKNDPYFEYEKHKDLYQHLLKHYKLLICYIYDIDIKNEIKIIDIFSNNNVKLLSGLREYKFKLYETYLYIKQNIKIKRYIPIRWLMMDKRNLILNILLFMHSSLLSYLNNDIDEAFNKLKAVIIYQNKLSMQFSYIFNENAEYFTEWFRLRNILIDHLFIIGIFSRKTINNYKKLGDWTV